MMRADIEVFVGEHSNRYKAYDVANRQAKRMFGWGGYRVISDTIERPWFEGGSNRSLTKWRATLRVIPTRPAEPSSAGAQLDPDVRAELERRIR